jgi:hypothetical protein
LRHLYPTRICKNCSKSNSYMFESNRRSINLVPLIFMAFKILIIKANKSLTQDFCRRTYILEEWLQPFWTSYLGDPLISECSLDYCSANVRTSFHSFSIFSWCRCELSISDFVWHPCFFFGKTQKPLSNSLTYGFGIFGELAKERAIGAYMHASGSRASAWHRSFSRGSSLLSGSLCSLSRSLCFLAGLLSFWNEIYQTVGDAIFFSPHIILGVDKQQDLRNQIGQTVEDARACWGQAIKGRAVAEACSFPFCVLPNHFRVQMCFPIS